MPAPGAAPTQTPDQKRLIAAVRTWAREHPDPKGPVVEVMGRGQRYSPEQIVHELENDTPTGRILLKVLESGAKYSSVEAVVQKFLLNSAKTDHFRDVAAR